MRLEGSLDAFGLPDVLALLAMTSKTGALHLHRETPAGAVDALVQVRAGLVAGVRADVHAQTLARRVLAAAPVDPARLTAVVENARGGRDLVDGLVESGLVDPATARRVAEADVAEALAALLDWDEGSFAFEAVDGPAGAGEVAVPVDALVADARRLADVPGSPAAGQVLALAAAVDADVTVNPDEWPLLALVDGRRSVADVVAVSGRSPRAVLADLQALLDRGVLTTAAGGPDAALARHVLLSSLEGSTARPAVPAVVTPAPAPVTVAVPAPVPVPVHVAPALAAPPHVEPPPVTQLTPASRPTEDLPPFRGFATDGSAALEPVPEPAPEVAPAVVLDGPVDDVVADADVTKTLLLRLIAGVRGL